MELIKTIQKVDNLIYDVGMHKGEDSDFYLKKGFRVVAFEADPSLVQLNQQKFSKQILDNQLTIVEGAIVNSKICGKVKFYKNLDNSVWGTVDSSWAARNEKKGTRNKLIEVNAIDFGKCIEQYGIPYYMKIDIESADIICIKELLKFNLRPSYVSIESEKVSFEKLSDEINLFEKLGFNRFMAIQQSNIHQTILPNPSKEGKYVQHKFVSGASGKFGKELNGEWRSKDEILSEYRLIFRKYKWMGDNSFLKRNIFGNQFLRIISKAMNKSIPGWYDTHAKHCSVTS